MREPLPNHLPAVGDPSSDGTEDRKDLLQGCQLYCTVMSIFKARKTATIQFIKPWTAQCGSRTDDPQVLSTLQVKPDNRKLYCQDLLPRR